MKNIPLIVTLQVVYQCRRNESGIDISDLVLCFALAIICRGKSQHSGLTGRQERPFETSRVVQQTSRFLHISTTVTFR